MRRILEWVWGASAIFAVMLLFLSGGSLYPEMARWFAGALLVTSLISFFGAAVGLIERRAYQEGYDDADQIRLREREDPR